MIKFFIDQHGCAKNQVDGEILISKLISDGYEQTFNAGEADLIIINSCGFIESAKKESLDAVYSARDMYPDAKIILAGCLAERYADALKDELIEADGFFGNGDLSKISEITAAVMKGKRAVVKPEQSGVSCGSRMTLLSYKGSAYVKITEGCSNHCSFCAIPLIRGELRSRKADDIIDEIKDLLSKGVFEINLIGQDLAAYGTGIGDDVFGDGRCMLPEIKNGSLCETSGKSALCRLLEKISALEGNFWVRLLYIHPDHFNRDILSVMKNDSRMLPYFDIPFQSGDTDVIRSMNRKCIREEYFRLVDDLRNTFPQVALRTTFLAGFAGETDESAGKTLDFLERIQSDWSGCFPYSKEEDTPGAQMKKQISKKVAAARASLLVAKQSEITKKKLASRTGKEYDVLIEEIVSGNEGADMAEDDGMGFAIGRAWFQAPEVDGSCVIRYEKDDGKALAAVKPGRVVRVKAVASSDVDIDAIFISDSPLNPVNSAEDGKSLKYAPEMV